VTHTLPSCRAVAIVSPSTAAHATVPEHAMGPGCGSVLPDATI
jgi:hypothetical protein